MALTQAQVKVEITLLRRALKTLQEAVRMKQVQIVRDGTVQRFEYVFELSWKAMKLAAEYKGTSSNSPRDAIRVAFKLGWIKKPQEWFDALEARNMTSHTYNRRTARRVYQVAKKFSPLVVELLRSLQKI